MATPLIKRTLSKSCIDPILNPILINGAGPSGCCVGLFTRMAGPTTYEKDSHPSYYRSLRSYSPGDKRRPLTSPGGQPINLRTSRTGISILTSNILHEIAQKVGYERLLTGLKLSIVDPYERRSLDDARQFGESDLRDTVVHNRQFTSWLQVPGDQLHNLIHFDHALNHISNARQVHTPIDEDQEIIDSVTPSLIVAADGPYSTVRTHAEKQSPLYNANILVYSCMVFIERHLYETHIKDYLDEVYRVRHKRDTCLLEIQVQGLNRKEFVRVQFIFSQPAKSDKHFRDFYGLNIDQRDVTLFDACFDKEVDDTILRLGKLAKPFDFVFERARLPTAHCSRPLPIAVRHSPNELSSTIYADNKAVSASVVFLGKAAHRLPHWSDPWVLNNELRDSIVLGNIITRADKVWKEGGKKDPEPYRDVAQVFYEYSIPRWAKQEAEFVKPSIELHQMAGTEFKWTRVKELHRRDASELPQISPSESVLLEKKYGPAQREFAEHKNAMFRDLEAVRRSELKKRDELARRRPLGEPQRNESIHPELVLRYTRKLTMNSMGSAWGVSNPRTHP